MAEEAAARGSAPPDGGVLLVVATPIGHLADASPRLVETLRSADLVLCEDTRRTGLLLQRLDIGRRSLRRCDEHEEARRIPEALELLRRGGTVALVSDAGTPLISDPGHRLVLAAVEAGHRVSPVPGPSALTALLSVCALPTSSFVFEGFLPRRPAARRRRLASLGDETRTLVFFETPHRLRESLDDLASVLGGERRACLGRELTKLHEEVVHDSLDGLRRRLAGSEPRGEVALAVAGASEAPPAGDDDIRAAYQALVDQGLPERDALKRTARDLGVGRREVYRVVKLRDDG